MDLIYTDAERADQGVLHAYALDLSYGKEENDFEVTLGEKDARLETGAFVYVENTEYGGMVDGLKTHTDEDTIIYKGRTWHGILNSKVIEPLKSGERLTWNSGETLPESYQRVEYIQSSGTQYINTGFYPNQNTRFLVDAQLLSSATTMTYGGGRTGTSVNQFGCWTLTDGVTLRHVYNTSLYSLVTSSYLKRLIIDVNKNVISAEGKSTTVSAATFTSKQPMFLFAMNTGGKAEFPANMKLYSCQIFDNGTLVRDFIPAIKKSDGTVGLYDIIGGTFYKNSGTGVFTAGAVIEESDSSEEYKFGAVAADGTLTDKYLALTGDANAVLGYLVERLSLDGLFVPNVESSGIAVTGYQFARYCKAYDGICAMLKAAGAKLQIAWKDKNVVLSAVPADDYTESPVDGDVAILAVDQTHKKVNHLVCLGQGELADRDIVHLFADESGAIGDTQHYTGLDEITDKYENTNAESVDVLREEGVKHFKELRDVDSAEISLEEVNGIAYDIGDIVGATDIVTGTTVTANVSQKIVRINNGVISTEYKVGG